MSWQGLGLNVSRRTLIPPTGFPRPPSRGRYSLSQRSAIELEPFLKAEYEDESLHYCAWVRCTGLVMQVSRQKGRGMKLPW